MKVIRDGVEKMVDIKVFLTFITNDGMPSVRSSLIGSCCR